MLGSNGQLNIPGVVNYFQDVCLFHSHDAGITLDRIHKRHSAWLLNSWYLIFHRFPKLGERVVVSTSPYEFRAIYGMRSFSLKTDDGELLAVADSIWFLYDSMKKKPIRPEQSELDAYGIGPRYDMPKAPRKIILPSEEKFIEKLVIYQNQLDTNHHVNNGEYVRISCNYIPDSLISPELRIEYKNAAVLGDIVNVYTAETADCFYVILRNEDGILYTVSEFRKLCSPERITS